MDIQEVKKQIIPIIRKYHITKAALFGSILTGKMHKDSDIDLLVELPKNHSLMDRARVKVDLEDKLKIKCDVLNFNGIKSHARESILSSQVTFFHET